MVDQGTDGAASMTGIKNGLGELLRKENPRLISRSCTNMLSKMHVWMQCNKQYLKK